MTTTPSHRVEFSGVRANGRPVTHTPLGWYVSRYGKATQANLEQYIRDFQDSTLPGGVNSHLGITIVGSAVLIHQRSDEVVAIYQAPVFQVV